jgi:hypothetical protein
MKVCYPHRRSGSTEYQRESSQTRLLLLKAMRILIFFLFCVSSVLTGASSLPFHAQLNSVDFGFGNGITILETARSEESSVLKVWRTYEYKGNIGSAWGTPQNFFLFCALRSLGLERKFTQAKTTYLVLEDGQLRDVRPGETMADIGAEQLYVRVAWLSGSNDNVEGLLAQKIIPFNAQLAETCRRFRTQQFKNR